MLSLHEYATRVYAYASPAMCAHLRHTVFAPLGLTTTHTRDMATRSNDDSDVHGASLHASPCGCSSNCAVDDSNDDNDSDDYTRLYALPPYTTNVRLCGDDLTRRSTQLASRLREEDNNDDKDNNNDNNSASNDIAQTTATQQEARQAWRVRYAPVQWLDHIGLPFCAIVTPRTTAIATTAADDGDSDSDHATRSSSSSSLPAVLVDTSCAEAVLRGSDVYAPGVQSVSTHFAAGTRVRLVWLVQRDTSSSRPRLRPAVAPPHCSYAQLLRRLDSCSDDDDSSETRDNNSSSSSTTASCAAAVFAVCVGYGVAQMSAKDMLQRKQRDGNDATTTSSTMTTSSSSARAHGGVVVQTTWSPRLQPSQRTLAALLRCPMSSSSSLLFLQNYSSMVPAMLLVHRLVAREQQQQRQQRQHASNVTTTATAQQRPWAVLDACAAPGGKASLLLSLLAEASTMRAFALYCCERSAARCAQLRRTLTTHFADTTRQHAQHDVDTNDNNSNNNNNNNNGKDNTTSSSCVQHGAAHASSLVWSRARSCAHVCHGDVLRLLRANSTTMTTTKQVSSNSSNNNGDACQTTAATAAAAAASGCVPHSGLDAILLDAPCTGLGLRPRLLPHAATCDDVRAAAAYQGKLLDACVAAMQPHVTTRRDRSSSSSRHGDCSGCTNARTAGGGDDASSGDGQDVRLLVYSTCTLTCEENEANVLRLLRAHAHVRLARARTPVERALCLQLHTTRYANAATSHVDACDNDSETTTATAAAHDCRADASVRFLLQRPIVAAQRANEAWLRAHGARLDDDCSDADADEDDKATNGSACSSSADATASSPPTSSSSPLLVLRFMPRHDAAASPQHAREDSVGFFVAVFEVYASLATAVSPS